MAPPLLCCANDRRPVPIPLAAPPAPQELLRLLPPELFRTCLARVLMVLFDILVSHFHMVRWGGAGGRELKDLPWVPQHLCSHA